MKKMKKKLFFTLLCVISFLPTKNNCVLGAQTKSVPTANVQSINDTTSLTKNNNLTAYIDTSRKLNVPLNKIWKVKFNQSLDSKSLKNSVKIICKDSNEELPVNVSLTEDNKVLSISSNYSPDKVYFLIINSGIKSKFDTNLKDTFSMEFKTLALSVSRVDDINTTIKKDTPFTLPSKLNVYLSDGTSQFLDVSWDTVSDTSVLGKHTYYGNIINYEKKVCLNLTIVPNSTVDTKSTDKDKIQKNTNKEPLNPPTVQTAPSHSNLQQNLYNYLTSKKNRDSTMKRAVELHGGVLSNNCVYFASESLRRSGLTTLPTYVCNTVTLISKLTNMGWKKNTDLSQLRPGDICFTIGYGYGPTHTYVFMNWANPGKYDYAYICDNQGSEYGNVYHKRNINFQTKEKDKIAYFMYKP